MSREEPGQRLGHGSTTIIDLHGGQELFEYMPGCYLITDSVGLILIANRAAQTLLGTPAESLIGVSLIDLFLDKEGQPLDHRFIPLFQGGSLEMEVTLKPRPGSGIITILLKATVICDSEQKPLQIICLLHNITAHKQIEHTLRQVNRALEQEVQARTAQVQKVLDLESMLKRVTDKVRDSLDESQILQTVVKELTLVLGLAGCNSALYDLDEGTSTIRYEYTSSIPRSQGRVAQMDNFPEIYRQLQQGYVFQFCSLVPNPVRGRVAMLACPIFVDPESSKGMDQAILGDLWLIHHIDHEFSESEIRLVQQVANQCAIAIRQARLYQAAQGQVQELEKLNRLKDEFLSTVSHELRTPIANVKMATHMLKLATTEERRQLYLNILESETIREAELIDELLDLQRLEAAYQPILVEVAQVQKWLPNVVNPFYSRAANRQQNLKIECPVDLPPLATDFTILQRILAELLNNACKYTAEGTDILLKVGGEDVSGDRSQETMIFQVCNQADIPPSELPHIFEKFYRVIQSDRYKQGGTGLGLALVQKRVEQLGGTIQAESKDGWTTFTVALPNHHKEGSSIN